jgi:hypothetical protein
MSTLSMPQEGRIDFASRISARAVVIGAAVALAALNLLMEVGAALGLFAFGSGPRAVLDAEVLRQGGAGLVVWAALSWIAAVFTGAFVATLSARATQARDGLLHGVATWAVVCVTAGVLTWAWFMAAIPLGLASPDVAGVMTGRAVLWSSVLAEVLAVAGALGGGFLGARSERRLPRCLEVRQEARARAIPTRQSM